MRPDRPGIPGADSAHVVDPVAAASNPDLCGSSVVLVDEHGDHTALSLALLLAEAGRQVEIVTHQMFVGALVATTLDIPWMYPLLTAAGVRLTPQSFVERIDANEVTIADMWGAGSRTAAAETVVLNLGRRPDLGLYEALLATGLEATRIGDCLVPREVDDAIYEGERIGRALTGQPTSAMAAHSR
jgi:hypothetical protein